MGPKNNEQLCDLFLNFAHIFAVLARTKLQMQRYLYVLTMTEGAEILIL